MQKLRQDPTLGSNIKRLRNAAGLTQEQVVAKLQLEGFSITRGTYAKIECGQYSVRVAELVALKKIFRVDYNAFFDGME